jgi:enamine deaminase RidA (YjgF/YER057c/UK114 family)
VAARPSTSPGKPPGTPTRRSSAGATCIYIVGYRPEKANAIGDALRDVFPEAARPATTWIGVATLAHEDFLIEIEATAVLE